MLTPDIPNFPKTVYDNDDSSPKNVQTPSVEVGAWDMERVAEYFELYLPWINKYKYAVELSELNPLVVYGLQDGLPVEMGQLAKKYLIRIADASALYNILITNSAGQVVDPLTTKFTCTFKPADMSASTYFFDTGVASSATEGNFYLRINNDGTLRVRRNDASNGNAQLINSSDALILNQDNQISLIDGVLTINGVDQNIDMSLFAPVTTVTQGIHFFALSNNGSSNLIGDIKSMSWQEEILEIFKIGAALENTETEERGTATYVLY